MLLKPRYVARFRAVAAVLIRHGFADVLGALDLARFLPGHTATAATPEARLQQRAQSLRVALEELGATYIKLGQILSTRPDLLPEPFLAELELLQDRVEPFAFDEVRKTIEDELGRPLGDIFTRIDETPVASASLSQVHLAELAPGPERPPAPARTVAVKVLRPGIEREVEVDLEILAEVARFAARSALGVRYDFAAIVEQLAQTLTGELDLTREARNGAQAAVAVAEFPRLVVPAVVDECTSRRVHVAAYFAGTRLADLPPDHADPDLARQLWRSYLKRILVEGTFQCDPHPGNFLLGPDGRIALLDHGMVAHLNRETQIQLLALLLALADHDGEEAAAAGVEIGIPGPDFRERAFRAEVGQLVARSSGLPLAELGFGRVMVDLLKNAFRNDIQVPPELMLLGKTLLNLEGVCRRLDPGMDPVAAMREMAGSLLAGQLGREFSKNRALAATLDVRSLLREGPASLRRILRRAAANDFRLGLRLEGASELQAAIQKVAGRITLGLITAALIVGSAMLLNVRAGWMLWGYPVFALVGFLLAAGLGLYLVGKIILVDRY